MNIYISKIRREQRGCDLRIFQLLCLEVEKDLRDIIKQLCAYKGVEILEGHIMPDHVHLLVSIPPKLGAAAFMGCLKGKS